MKTIAALIAGLLLSTMTFVAGLAIALTLLNIDEPEHKLDGSNTTALWSTEPVAVDSAAQPFERIPARPVPKIRTLAALDSTATSAKAEVEATADTDPFSSSEHTVDPMTTGAIDRPADSGPSAAEDAARDARMAAHVEWCSRRYRSYNAEDDSYRPYGGGLRTCRSPYSDPAEASPDTAGGRDTLTASAEQVSPEDDPALMEQAAYEGDWATEPDMDHIQSCFARYRSYRPEDNSYQPYDGGPRQQCR